MEAIGRLAGGVAHDFNNLLTAISGYANLVLDRLRERDSDLVDDVARSTRPRSAHTGSRGSCSPSAASRSCSRRSCDINDVVGDMDGMLRRLIGEDIEIVTAYGSGLARVKADPGQLEQVIINLVVNARDAMPGGGTLSIETANVAVTADEAARHGAEVDAGLVRDADDPRHRPRHGRRDEGAPVRAVLHDEGRRQGNRPRPRDRLRDRQAERRLHRRRERARRGRVVRDLPAGGDRRGRGAGRAGEAHTRPSRRRAARSRSCSSRTRTWCGATSRRCCAAPATACSSRDGGPEAIEVARQEHVDLLAHRRRDAEDQRPRARGTARPAGAVHVRLHRRPDRAARAPAAGHGVHPEAVQRRATFARRCARRSTQHPRASARSCSCRARAGRSE